jgi:hypothetical protein
MRYLTNMVPSGMPFDREKLRAAVLYVVGSCAPSSLGAVKLHKVLYYSDMMTYLASGKAITGAEYRKRPYGPTCDAILPLLGELSREGILKIEHVSYYGYRKKEFQLLVESDSNQLSSEEKATLDEMMDFVCNQNSARTISEFSHDMVWEMVEFGEVIPYHNAILLVPNVVSDEAIAWAEAEGTLVADARSKSADQTVAGRDARDFRARLVELRSVRTI